MTAQRFKALGESTLQAIPPFGIGDEDQRVMPALGEGEISDLNRFILRQQAELVKILSCLDLFVAIVEGQGWNLERFALLQHVD